MQSNLRITVIYGRAGTGKSTVLATMIKRCVVDGSSFVVLTATHSSLNNIYNITESFVRGDAKLDPLIDLRSHFRTIYSYFRIDYDKDILAGCIRVPNFVFVDEFSLINKKVFKKIVRDIETKANSTVNLVLTGDMLQLNAIYKNKQYISFHKLHRLCNLSKQMSMLHVPVIEHVHLSIFGLKDIMRRATKKQLTKNYRNSSFVSEVMSAIYNKDQNYQYPFIDDINECVSLIDSGYVFVSSMYKHIQQVYDALNKVWRESREDVWSIDQPISYRAGLKRLHLYPGIELMVTVTSKIKDNNNDPLYYNGEYVKWCGTVQSTGELDCINAHGQRIYINKEVDDSIVTKPTYYPVIPKALITVHKAQGQTIDNVIVCIDDIFDMCMLYTAITRASKDIKFYTTKGARDRVSNLFAAAYTEEFRQLTNLLTKMNGKLIDTENTEIEGI